MGLYQALIRAVDAWASARGRGPRVRLKIERLELDVEPTASPRDVAEAMNRELGRHLHLKAEPRAGGKVVRGTNNDAESDGA